MRGSYFGIPGHCFDIDGDLWHDPGECKDVECRRRPCCGYRGDPPRSATPRLQLVEIEDPGPEGTVH